MRTLRITLTAVMLVAGLASSIGAVHAQVTDPDAPGAWVIHPDGTEHFAGNDRHSDIWGSDLSTSIHEALGYSGQLLYPGPNNDDIGYWENCNPPPEGSIIELRGPGVWEIGGDGAQGGKGREKMKSLVVQQNGITIRGQDYDDGTGNMLKQEIFFNNGATTALFYLEAADLTIENLHVRGTWPNNSGGYALTIGRYTMIGPDPNATGLTVTGNTFTKLRAMFDERPTVADLTVLDNRVENTYYNIFKKGVTFTGDNIIADNTLVHVGEDKSYPAVQILGNSGTACIDANTFDGWRAGQYAIQVEVDIPAHPIGLGVNNDFVDQLGGSGAAYEWYPLTSGGHAVGATSADDVNLVPGCGEPTVVTLVSFTAEAGLGSVVLAWETGTEIDNAGFNLYRATAEGGPYAKVNGALIAAEGDPVSGAGYSFLDKGLSPGTYFYKLEDVDLTGTTTLHGPVSAAVLPRLRRPTYRPTLP